MKSAFELESPPATTAVAQTEATPALWPLLPENSAPLLASNCLPPGCGNAVESTGEPLDGGPVSPPRAPTAAAAGLLPDLPKFPPPSGLPTASKDGVWAVYSWLRGRVAAVQMAEEEANEAYTAFASAEVALHVRSACTGLAGPCGTTLAAQLQMYTGPSAAPQLTVGARTCTHQSVSWLARVVPPLRDVVGMQGAPSEDLQQMGITRERAGQPIDAPPLPRERRDQAPSAGSPFFRSSEVPSTFALQTHGLLVLISALI